MFGHPELLDGFVERHQVLLQQDLAGVDVDEGLDGRHVRCPGAPDHEPVRLGSPALAHSYREGIGSLATDILLRCRASRHTDPVSPARPRGQSRQCAHRLRMVLVPVFLVALFVGDGHETRWRVVAFIVFAVAVITDRFDGALARSYGMVTEFGTLADPIADKALIGAALIGLSMLGDLPWWVTAVILVREIGVTVLRLAVMRRGVIPASRGGKLKTLVQAVAIGLFVLPLSGALADRAWVIMRAAMVLTVITGVDYLRLGGQGFAWPTALVNDDAARCRRGAG